MNQQQKPSFTSAALLPFNGKQELQCGGHSNPPVEGDASHIFTTADGDRFVKTGTSFSKRRRLTSRSTESSTSPVQSLLAGPAPCETSEYHRLVLENATVNVQSSVTPWRPTPPQPPPNPPMSAIQLALAELPEQNRRLAAFELTLAEIQEQARRQRAASIPAPSPSVVQQRTTGIRRGNVSIKYTREEKRRNRTIKNRIWRETRRRTHHKVPDDYVFQPKITDAIVEEELEDEMELRVDDSLVVDNGGTDNDDDNDVVTNGDGNDDNSSTNDGDSDDDDDGTQTDTEQDDDDDEDDDGNDTSGSNAVQLGSMYIHDPRYPTHSAVRRSCRVAARQTTL